MRRLVVFAAAACCVLSSAAKIVVEKLDGGYVYPASPSFESVGNGEYTLGGVPLPEIKAVYNNPVAQPCEGQSVVLGAQAAKPAAVLDMNARNKVKEDSDDGRYLYSAEYIMQVAGFPYFATDDLDKALAGASMILMAGSIDKNTFSDDEYDKLTAWVEGGGVLVAPAIELNAAGKCFDLFGLEGARPKLKTHTTIRWVDEPLPELAYIDTDEERETYIGENYIFTTIYEPGQAQALASYDDTADVAAIKHKLGKGCAYSVGVRWRDVAQRCQLNKSGKNRVKNNHFEGSADVYPLFVRACYAANVPVTVWKHTIPGGYESVLIPTHDCDSRTAYDEMHWIAEYEMSLGLRAHFFLTVHYFRQPGYLSAFYNEETIPAARALLDMGHTVGSHSVCHLPDFSTTDRFPMTVTTPEEYAEACKFDIDSKTTTGGSTWAEVVMSKQIIERDLGNSVRSFRSGHLCFNGNIPQALADGGYSFASCFTATDLWGSFPFFQRYGMKWSGDLSNVLQMPLHYSDVRPTGETMTEQEIEGTMPVWMDMHLKLKGNYAPNILLIHPNSKWKMEAERQFVDLLDPKTVGLCNFEDYGDFWIKRLELDYEYSYDDGQVAIIVKADDLAPYKGQGLFVEGSGPIESIAVADSSGRVHAVRVVKVADGKYIAVL